MQPPQNLEEAIALEEAGIPTEEVWKAFLGEDGMAALSQALSPLHSRWIERLYLEAITYTIQQTNHPATPLAEIAVDRIRRDAKKPERLSQADMPTGARARHGMHDYRWREGLLQALSEGRWRNSSKPITRLIFEAKKLMQKKILEDEADNIKAHKQDIDLTSLEGLPVEVSVNLRAEAVGVPRWSWMLVAELRAELRAHPDLDQYAELRTKGWKVRAIWEHLGLTPERGRAVDRQYRRCRQKIKTQVMQECGGAARAGQSDASVFYFLERLFTGHATYQHKGLDLDTTINKPLKTKE